MGPFKIVNSNTYEMSVSVGDIVEFGHYYQDFSHLKWAVKVKWLVVKTISQAALLVSSDALYVKCFDYSGITSWEDSSLRKWLNGTWLENTFQGSDRSYLFPTSCKNPLELKSCYRKMSNDFKHKDGNQDYVFLLSADEVSNLIGSFYCQPSKLLSSHTGETGSVSWWIRPVQGDERNCIDESENPVYCDTENECVFVRPAIWVDNYLCKHLVNKIEDNWKQINYDVKENTFDYELFKKAAIDTYELFLPMRSYINTVTTLSKIEALIMVQICLFSFQALKNETGLHQLAQNAAKSFIMKLRNWPIIYAQNPDDSKSASLLFTMYGLNDELLVIDATTFDLEKPIPPEKLKEKYYGLNGVI